MRVREFGAGICLIIRFNYSNCQPSLAGRLSLAATLSRAFRLTRKVLIEAFSIPAARLSRAIANDVKFHDSLIYIHGQCIDNAP